MTKYVTKLPSRREEQCLNKLREVLAEYEEEFGMQVIMAITSQLVGNLVVLQDQRFMTSAEAMEIVGRNIEIGNALVVEQVQAADGVPN